jgi:hypothetical protein
VRLAVLVLVPFVVGVVVNWLGTTAENVWFVAGSGFGWLWTIVIYAATKPADSCGQHP